jgi:magnesium chelatase subunit D
MQTDALFPFVAFVGQEMLKRGLEIALVNPKAGGILLGGPKGTAKSSIVRACGELCRPRTIVEVPLNATEDMLFGSIDIEYAVNMGKKKFLQGILSRANDNILYVDEVNLLRTELLTAILDANASGVNLVERDGISFSHVVHTTVIGTMNPEEGSLTSSVLDRFGMYAEAVNEQELEKRKLIMRRLLDFSHDIAGFKQAYAQQTKELLDRINNAQKILGAVEISEAMMQLAAQMCAKAFCAGHRAEIYMLEAAKAIAALAERSYMLPKDIEEAAQYVLPHRMRKLPEQQEEKQDEQEIEQEQDDQEQQEQDEQDNPPDNSDEASSPPPLPNDDNGETEQDEDNDDNDNNGEDDKEDEKKDQQENLENNAPEEKVDNIDKSFHLPKMIFDMGQDCKLRHGSGKRCITKTDLKQGRYVRSAMSNNKIDDIAFDATIRAAAPYQKMRGDNGCALNIKSEDIRQKIREKRIGSTFLFVVDASGSMGARERMGAVKGAIFYMLQEAYQKRDRVGMIAFRRQKAEVLLPITRSIDLAQKCLQEMPTGGKTPLADGLATALLTLYTKSHRDSDMEPILILVTDGRANYIDESGNNPVDQALAIGEKIGKAGITSVVIDTETDFIKLGIAKDLAKAMNATYYSLKQLSEEQIIRVVRNVGIL